MELPRRIFLKSLGFFAVAIALVKPLFASERNRAAFNAENLADTLKSLGITSITETKAISIKAADITENGAAVPIEISTSLPNVQTLAVLVEKNPFPLTASFNFFNGALPFVSLRIKMAETSLVRAVVFANGKHYTAAKEVKVTIGGCG